MSYQDRQIEVGDGEMVLGSADLHDDAWARESRAGYGVCSICSCAGFRSPGTSTNLCTCGHDFADHG